MFCFNHAMCFNLSKHKGRCSRPYHTYLWFHCIMPIQSILLCDTGSGKHRQIVNWTSSFKSKGKLRPPKKLEKKTRCYKTLRQIGDDVKCQASCDETAGAVCIPIWCTDTLVNLLICIKMVSGTFCQLFNIASSFLWYFSNNSLLWWSRSQVALYKWWNMVFCR